MIKIADGKTKDVYKLDDGNFLLFFKDDMTGVNGVFDPGANAVGLTVDGAGRAGLLMSVYYFKLLESKGVSTHFISVKDNEMTVKPVDLFGRGLEVICRYKALGSFIRRYGDYISDGDYLDAVVEISLKDDKRGDPFINEETLVALKILKPGEYPEIKSLTKKICSIIKTDLAEKGLELCDIKLEFGRSAGGDIILIDEISGGNMRVLENGTPVAPIDLSERIV